MKKSKRKTLGLNMELLYTLIIRTSRWLKTIFRHLKDWEPNHLKHQTPKSVLVQNYTETKVCLLPIEEGVTLSSPRYARCGESCLKFSLSLSEYSNIWLNLCWTINSRLPLVLRVIWFLKCKNNNNNNNNNKSRILNAGAFFLNFCLVR